MLKFNFRTKNVKFLSDNVCEKDALRGHYSMVRVDRQKASSSIIFFSIACLLLSLLSHEVIASSSIRRIDFAPPIIQLLLDDSNKEEDQFGSLIPGKLYSAAELGFWRARANTGPHVVRGDAYGTPTTGSSPDYVFIQASAQAFISTDDSEMVAKGISRADLINKGLTEEELSEITFSGDCAALDSANSNTFYDWYEFGRIDLARDAAFIDLLNGTAVQTGRIKSLLLEQAQQPCMDFTNREIFRNGVVNNNGFWLTLEWVHRVLKTYDYLDDSAFTAPEKAIVDNWFKGAAEWAYYYVSTIFMEPVYSVRASNPINSVIDLPDPDNPNNTGYWLNREAFADTRIRYKGSSVFWPAGNLINNRHLGQVNFVAHAGVKFGVDEWRKEGAQIVKEYVSFHFDGNGYYAELKRSSDASSQASMDIGIPLKAESGLGYGANSLINIADIANVLYLDGYENLFEYRSKAQINEDSGEIETGTVEKSLEWVLLKFRDNFMLHDSPAIYPLGLTDEQENTDTVIHFCNNTHREKLGTLRLVGLMYNSSVIINRYYKNSLIKDMYNASENHGNLCGFVDTNIETRPGPHSISPGNLFQYSDADENY